MNPKKKSRKAYNEKEDEEETNLILQDKEILEDIRVSEQEYLRGEVIPLSEL